MRYRDNPDDPERPFLDVTVQEIARYRRTIMVAIRGPRFGLSRADREDIAQDVVIQAWIALKRGVLIGHIDLAPGDYLLRYLVTSAVYRAHNLRRRHEIQEHYAPLADPMEVIARAPCPAPTPDQRTAVAGLLRAVEGMTGDPGVRALVMHAHGDLPGEIASATGLSRSGAFKRIAEGWASVRRHLGTALPTYLRAARRK